MLRFMTNAMTRDTQTTSYLELYNEENLNVLFSFHNCCVVSINAPRSLFA